MVTMYSDPKVPVLYPGTVTSDTIPYRTFIADSGLGRVMLVGSDYLRYRTYRTGISDQIGITAQLLLVNVSIDYLQANSPSARSQQPWVVVFGHRKADFSSVK